MDRELEERIAGPVARGAACLRDGGTLDEVLRAFREDDQLGFLESIVALRAIENISMIAAKDLVSLACDGRQFPQLGLADLRQLATIPRARAGSSLHGHLEEAIISGRPWKLFVRDVPGRVLYFNAATPDPASGGSIGGRDVSLDRIRQHVVAALAEPEWQAELRIVRDEPDLLLVHFVRVRERTVP